jgi:hypothetical protein
MPVLSVEWLKESRTTLDVISVHRRLPDDWNLYAEWLTRRFHVAFELHLVDGLDVRSALTAAAKYGVEVIGHPTLKLDYLLGNIGFPDGLRPIHPTRSAIESVPATNHTTNAEITYNANIRIAFNRAIKSIQAQSQRHERHSRLQSIIRRFRVLKVEDDIFRKEERHQLRLKIAAFETELGVEFIESEYRYVLKDLPGYLRTPGVEKMRQRAPRKTDIDRETNIAKATGLRPEQRTWALVALINIHQEAMYDGLVRWRAGCLLHDHARARKYHSRLTDYAAEQPSHESEPAPSTAAALEPSASDLRSDQAVALSAAKSEVDESNWRECLLKEGARFDVSAADLLHEFDRRASQRPQFKSFRPR